MMKKKYCAMILLAGLLAAGGCSRDKGASSFDGIFDKLCHARNYSEAKRYYTGGTIDAIDSAVREGVITEKEKLRILPLFNEKTKWEEVFKKVEGSRGVVRLRYTEHPVENMIGFETDFRVLKEGGSWKIDLGDEIRQALRGRADGSTAKYIQRIKKGYIH
jgi:hypothetical protein